MDEEHQQEQQQGERVDDQNIQDEFQELEERVDADEAADVHPDPDQEEELDAEAGEIVGIIVNEIDDQSDQSDEYSDAGDDEEVEDEFMLAREFLDQERIEVQPVDQDAHPNGAEVPQAQAHVAANNENARAPRSIFSRFLRRFRGSTNTVRTRRAREDNEPITFDRNLPRMHAYLGSDLQEVSGRTIFEHDSIQSLPLITLASVVLMPGQLLPLNEYHPHTVAMLRNLKEGDRTLAFIPIAGHDDSSGETMAGRSTRAVGYASIGCTAEMRMFKEEHDEATEMRTVKVVLVGRQRCKLLETKRSIDGTQFAIVRITEDFVQRSPFASFGLSNTMLCNVESDMPYYSYSASADGNCTESLMRSGEQQASTSSHQTTSDYASSSGSGALNLSTQRDAQRSAAVYRLRRRINARLCRTPSFVFERYDVRRLIEQLRIELSALFVGTDAPSSASDIRRVPFSNAIALSFWLMQNLPLNYTVKLELLAIDSCILRLMRLLSIVRASGQLVCLHCNVPIAARNGMFAMSVDGFGGAFVNPHGHVHDVITVRYATVTNVQLIGRPSTDSSWFDGYAWTIAQCRSCHSHLGWRFTATRRDLKPIKFYGLCRNGLTMEMRELEASELEAAEAERQISVSCD